MQAIGAWTARQNLTELASDTLLPNHTAQAMHAALGFTKTERVVFYTKPILPPT